MPSGYGNIEFSTIVLIVLKTESVRMHGIVETVRRMLNV